MKQRLLRTTVYNDEEVSSIKNTDREARCRLSLMKRNTGRVNECIEAHQAVARVANLLARVFLYKFIVKF